MKKNTIGVLLVLTLSLGIAISSPYSTNPALGDWAAAQNPSPMTSNSPSDEIIHNQEIVSGVADHIYGLADENFVDIHTDAANLRITAYWKGEPASDVATYMRSDPEGVHIMVDTSATVSRIAEHERVARIVALSNAEKWAVQSVVPFMEQDMIQVAVGPESQLRDSDLSRISEVSGLSKVEIIHNDIQDFGLVGRLNDAAPFKGGARTIQNGHVCSTGFAVLSGASGRLLSARHCDPTSNYAIKNGDSTVTITNGGSGVSGMAALDSEIIDPIDSPATTPKIYNGSWSSGANATVKSWHSNWVGDTVCLSGATSGNRCGLVIDDSFPYVYNGYSIDTILVEGPAGGIMASSGDSGGPAYGPIGSGVDARGIIDAISPSYGYHHNCSSFSINPDVSSPICSRYVLYIPISTVLNAWGVSLEVG